MFVALRDLRFAKGRFALTAAVVVLITTLVGLLSGLTAGLGHQNTAAVTSLRADRIAFGTPQGQDLSYADSQVTERQWQRWAATPGVARAEPLGISTTRATAGERTGAVSVLGVGEGSRLLPPGTATGARTAVLSEGAAEELGARAGSRVALAGRTLTVSAVRGDDWFSHTPVVWTSLDVWRSVAPRAPGESGPTATVIALATKGGADLAAADRAAGTRTVSKEDSLAAIGSYTSENGSLQLMRAFLFVISALVVGTFFTVWTVQRSADIAVLKALGASTPSLLGDALGQAVLLLTAGSLAGAAAAAGLGSLLGDAAPFLLTWRTVLLPAAVTTLLGALGAALAVRRVTSVDPLHALGSAR